MPNPANMCLTCLRTQVDITFGIPRDIGLSFCRGCGRYLCPPHYWVKADLESKELLSLCLRRVRGLKKGGLKLVDASFVWTEPHSRRIKLKLTVEKEMFESAVLQQSLVVEFTVSTQMCEMCIRVGNKMEMWAAVVQLRQRVDHKRTFLFLEQLILRHRMHESAVGIKSREDSTMGGLDFFFSNRSHAIQLLNFLQTVSCLHFTTSKQLISSDDHNNTYNYKYGFIAELATVCKDDLVCLPPKWMTSFGGHVGPLVLCQRVNAAIHLLDPTTLETCAVPGAMYFKNPFSSLMTRRDWREFMVLDVEIDRTSATSSSRFTVADVTVARMEDLGQNDRTFCIRSHLGRVLHAGDVVVGYDVGSANPSDEHFERFMRERSLPDIVLVRKKKAVRYHKAHLKRLPIEHGDGKGAGTLAEKEAADMDALLDDLADDSEMRSGVMLFRNKEREGRAAAAAAEGGREKSEDGTDDGGIPDSELIDEGDELPTGDDDAGGDDDGECAPGVEVPSAVGEAASGGEDVEDVDMSES